MIDKSLMVTLLTVLREQRVLTCGTEESALFNELNLRANQPVVTPLIREHLNKAEDNGWIVPKSDTLRSRRWKLTPVGAGALDDLKSGG